MGLEVSVLLVTALHRYRELFVLETGTQAWNTILLSQPLELWDHRPVLPYPTTLMLKIISVRFRFTKSCNEFPTSTASAASTATWEAAESTSVRAFGLLLRGDCLTGT